VVCPFCGENVCIGSAGPAGLVQHEGKGPCCKAQAKKEQLKNARTLFDIGVKRAKDIPLSAPTANHSLRDKGPSPIMVPENPQQIETHQSNAVSGGQEPQGCKQG